VGKKLNGNCQDEMGNRYNVRIEGTRGRHSMGLASIKMHDKFGHILRIETTAKDVSFFKHYCEVEQRNGEAVMKFAPLKKTIYSLGVLRELLSAANRRYLEFLSALDDPRNGITSSTKSREPFMRRRDLIAASTFSTPRMRRSFWRWLAGNSLSAVCRTKRCALAFPDTTAARCPESCADFACTGSSKRRATATSTT